MLPFFSRGEPRGEDDNSITEMSDHELFDHDDAPSSSESDDVDSDSNDKYDDDQQPDHDVYPANYQPENADNDAADSVPYDEVDRVRMLDMQNPTGPYETVEPDDLYARRTADHYRAGTPLQYAIEG